MPDTTATEIGQYRPAHRVREGWQIRVPDQDTNAPSWMTVTHILRVYSPINFVRFTFDNDDTAVASTLHDADVFCRTATEVRKAGPAVCSQCPAPAIPRTPYCSTACRNLDDRHDNGGAR